MRLIRSRDTRPEIEARRLVYALGYRYRLHDKTLPGSPDLVFKGRRKVIFVHGCFWHLHANCRNNRPPKSRREYWQPKLERNAKRDEESQRRLREMGWAPLVIWECELVDRESLAKRIRDFLEPS